LGEASDSKPSGLLQAENAQGCVARG